MGGWVLLEVLEVIRCMMLCMLEADSLFAGGAGSDALSEVTRCVLLCTLEADSLFAGGCWRC